MPIPLPALDVKTPQIENPMDAYSKALSVQSLIQGNQMQSMQLQQAQQDQKDRQLFRQELTNNNGDLGKTAESVKARGGSLEMVLKLENASLQHRQQIAATTDAELGVQKKYADFENSAIDAVKKAPADKKAEIWQAGRATLAQLPGYDLSKIPQDYPGDEQVDLLSTLHMGHTEALKEQLDQRKVAAEETASNARMIQARNSGKEGELPLGQDRVAQYNDLFKQRYAVLNPTKQLPATYQLPADATGKDFDRVDKMLESTEKAFGTKAQLDATNALREQTASLAKQNQTDREDKEGMQPVTGTDPKNGREVLVSAADAKKMGVVNPMKADADMVNKATAARHWMPLAEKNVQPELSNPKDTNSVAKNADQMGILQLIDRLDKRGELGTIASRWNDFMAGKVGAGDTEFQALRAKMKLSTTKLMQAHVGSRGGAFMLEHFEDIANTGKMDASTLREGVLSELDYMRDVAMSPDKAGAAGSKAGGSHPFFSKFGGTVR